jgi:hypothetical protein
MDRFTGGCLCGNVRIVASGLHAVLADGHRDLVGAAVLGGRTKHSCRDRGRAEAPRALAPGGLHRLPRRDLPGAAQLGREGLPNLIYFNEVDKGGHFAAWEEPELFSSKLRAAFRSLR